MEVDPTGVINFVGTGFSDYYEMLETLRQLVVKRDVSLECLEESCGLAKGHASQLLKQKPLKRMTAITAMTMFQALGCKLVAVDDPAQAARVARMIRRRKRAKGPGNASVRKRPRQEENPSRKQWVGNSEWSKQMNLRRATLLTPEFVKRLARSAARKRWSKPNHKG